MNFISRLVTTAVVLPMISTAPVMANSIIENDMNRRSNLTADVINRPMNGGTTTLKEKCEALNYYTANGNLGGVFNMGFQMGYEHEGVGDVLSTQDACRIVGVWTN